MSQPFQAIYDEHISIHKNAAVLQQHFNDERIPGLLVAGQRQSSPAVRRWPDVLVDHSQWDGVPESRPIGVEPVRQLATVEKDGAWSMVPMYTQNAEVVDERE